MKPSNFSKIAICLLFQLLSITGVLGIELPPIDGLKDFPLQPNQVVSVGTSSGVVLRPDGLTESITTVQSVSSNTLPPGLTLSPLGLLSGTPTAKGNYIATIRHKTVTTVIIDEVLTSLNDVTTDRWTLPISIADPSITSALALSITRESALTYQITTDLPAPAGFTATGLPDGLEIDLGTGVISGVSTVGGRYPVTITATQGGTTATATLVISVGFVVRVQSDYGSDKIAPSVGQYEATVDEVQTYEAPNVVYLNQNFEEISTVGDIAALNDSDPSNDSTVAHYRAVNRGYSINGGGGQTAQQIEGDKFKITVTVDTDFLLEWLWELEYAVLIESETDVALPGTSGQTGTGTGNPVPVVGRTFYPKDTDFTAEIDRVVNPDGSGFRFSSSGYEYTTGVPREGSDLGFVTFEENSQGVSANLEIPNFGFEGIPSFFAGNFSFIETRPLRQSAAITFRARTEGPLSGGRDQVFLSLADLYRGAFYTRNTLGNVDFHLPPDIAEGSDAVMNVGIRANGRFFVDETIAGVTREIAGVQVGNDTDLHHWAVVFENTANGSERSVTIFRDTEALLTQDLTSAPDVPGILKPYLFDTVRFGNPTEPFAGALDNLSVYFSSHSGSFPVPDLVRANAEGYIIGIDGIPDILSRGYTERFDRLPTQFNAIPAVTGLTYSPISYTLQGATFVENPEVFPSETVTVSLDGLAGDRVATQSFTINSWLRIKWLWEGEIRYRFDAAGGDATTGDSAFLGQSFVRTFTGGTPDPPVFGTDLTNNDVWVPLGSKVEVGSFYRTADRCFTLADFPGSLGGDLSLIGNRIRVFEDSDVPDSGGVVRLARTASVEEVKLPTEVHWFYQPTVYRAEIPLGGSLDAVDPGAQLVPQLCAGGVLRAGKSGPVDGHAKVGPDPGGSPVGDAFRWDELGKRLFPTHPGSYIINWPDQDDPAKSYRIEVVSGFPGEAVALASAREAANGRRLIDVNGEFVRTTALAPTGPAFPGAPDAHYRHLFDTDATRRAPTRLDLSDTDSWKFKEILFSEQTPGVQVDAATEGIPFSAPAVGRSVLLYSFRPNSDEIADGTLAKENLAVRVIRSEEKPVVFPDDPLVSIGRRGLLLDDAAEISLVNKGAAPASPISPGEEFVVDFWLNAKGLQPGDAPVTAVQMGATGQFSVSMDPAAATISATYRGVTVTRPLPRAGSSWRHYVVHVFTDRFFNTPVTVVDFYIDGVREEQALVSSLLTVPGSIIAPVETFRFGVDADRESGLLIDNFRLFANVQSATGTDKFLSSGEVRTLRTNRDASVRNTAPSLAYDFEAPPVNDCFANTGSLTDLAIGSAGSTATSLHARLDLQEVATRIESVLDDAGFGGSGYVINDVSNYNANLYDRAAVVGTWGPVFPVNHHDLFTDPKNALEIAYYENPFLANEALHPNVAWPYQAARYDEVTYPTFGSHRRKAIYIASRIGSEGVDQDGRAQEVFDLARYSDFVIYNQPDDTLAGFNPNEEHAIAAPTGRPALKVSNVGEGIANNPPLAAFALQNEINVTPSTAPGYTSDPWVLVQVQNLATGEPEMAAYQVFGTRAGDVPFPRPSDTKVAATDGLEFGTAPVPENRLLITDPNTPLNFAYTFDYPAFAGDLLRPPYPLNTVIGNIRTPDARGGNIRTGAEDQRTFWRDVKGNPWVVSGGGGKFFHQFFYPMRAEFYLPGATPGQPVAWLPTDRDAAGSFLGDSQRGTTNLDDLPRPVKVEYTSNWRTDYPKLKRGETLTFQGGEFFNETPGSNGLPALVAMKAAEVVFDAATPSMVITDGNVDSYSARVVRALDRRESPFTVADMQDAGFTPASQDKIFIVAERWYFKELPGSLQRRFYFDSLAQKLVFRGFLNDRDSGDPDLTSGPDPINILEPNVLTTDEKKRLDALSTNNKWLTATGSIFVDSQAPHPTRRIAADGSPEANITGQYLAGVTERPGVTAALGTPSADEKEHLLLKSSINTETVRTWVKSVSPQGEMTYSPQPLRTGHFVHLDSFGAGSALVQSPALLTAPVDNPHFVTIAENNRAELDGAPVSLHIIEIIPDRFRGAIKVIEPADAFSEKISLQHSGEFGANTDDLYYEWWIRDTAPLDTLAAEINGDGTLAPAWQEYIPTDRATATTLLEQHRGSFGIVFEGSPDVVLSDKLVLVRYRHVLENDWTLVPFDGATAASWKSQTSAPFQWAGAANSPQLQADGSKRYIPQLVFGWVKRILDRINPYEARYTDFFSNESPATYSSQIQIAGGPFAGKVALNPDKNVIENTGLIELYETVLQRARELSIDNSTNTTSTPSINQALLLAATRLAVLYEILAGEAYSDAQDSAVAVTDDELNSVASFTHAFQNFEATLLDEELALLRGTDFRKSFPVFNRMFWNYAKGLGEAAYNVNYNIYDENADGFINEDDARALFPQGHGDSWGHYLSATGMHYELLQAPTFSWAARSELYALLQNVLEVDFLDEKTFAKLAAGKARAGRDIVRGTYRLNHTYDPDGQWQGYADTTDPARAWGVSEWASRAGQAAYFDWAVANALLPDDTGTAENLERIERSAAESEIGEISAGLLEIQVALDEANGGVNPLGFDSDAMAFDLQVEFYEDASGGDRRSHFEQVHTRAVTAANNALATLDFASAANNKLRRIADDTNELLVEALRQDLDYRNRLIEIFGRPYDGTIGFGKVYPEGYQGPDTLLFSYLDKINIEQFVPQSRPETDTTVVHFNSIYKQAKAPSAMDNGVLSGLYNSVWGATDGPVRLARAFETFIGNNEYELENIVKNLSLPYETASEYGFLAQPDWGTRTSYGSTQTALQEMVLAEIALDEAIIDYIGFLQDFEVKAYRLDSELELLQRRGALGDDIQGVRAGLGAAIVAADVVIGSLEIGDTITDRLVDAINKAIPDAVGLAVDAFGAAQAATIAAATAASSPLAIAREIAEISKVVAQFSSDEVIASIERDLGRLDSISEIEGLIEEIANLSGADQPKRDTIGAAVLEMELKRQEYITAQAEGFRLLREREAFNKSLAAAAQGNRYEDMIFRLTRNEAAGKYESAFDNAARYTWLAARAYDYETALDPGDPAAASTLFDKIVRERQLGLFVDGEPQAGQGGLAEILSNMTGNFGVLKGQLGISNPQSELEKMSLRGELFRIGSTAASSNDRWKDALKTRIVPDLTKLPEFTRYCRPFSTQEEGPQPGLVIRFSSHIENGLNFFGNSLLPGDHAYSTANYATKIRGFGVWLENYNAAGLSTTPRGYLVPVGNDYLRTSSTGNASTRIWSITEQRIPTPFTINTGQLQSPGFIPTLNGVDGGFAELRRHGDFRMYHDNGDPMADDSELTLNTRLISRSVWNSEWLLIIPGANLHADPATGLEKLADTITDIKLHFQTYTHQGQ